MISGGRKFLSKRSSRNNSDTVEYYRGTIPYTNDPQCWGAGAFEDVYPQGKMTSVKGKWGEIETAPGYYDFADLR